MAWAQGFIDSDIDQIAAALHPDYVHDTFPRSLKIPKQNKEQWIEGYIKVKDVLKNFKVCRRLQIAMLRRISNHSVRSTSIP